MKHFSSSLADSRGRMQFISLSSLVLLTGFVASTHSIQAKTAREVIEPQDRIEVVAHYPLTNGPVARLIPTQHYSRNYLYAEQADGKGVTVIDVTNPTAPSLVANVSYSDGEKAGDLLALTGTAALVASPVPAHSEEVPPIVRIMSFADPAHPKVSREFTGVTAIGGDSQRGLVFLANSNGIWILSERFAEDPALVNAYAEHLRYDH